MLGFIVDNNEIFMMPDTKDQAKKSKVGLRIFIRLVIYSNKVYLSLIGKDFQYSFWFPYIR